MTGLRRVGLAVMAMVLGAASLASADPPGRVARLSYLRGAVSFLSGGLTDWAPALLNYPLTTGDALWVDRDGWAELHVGSAGLRLATETGIAVVTLDDRAVQIRLTQGALLLRIKSLERGEIFEVDTPAGAVTLTEPGAYRLVVDPGQGFTAVTVRFGGAEVTGAGGSVVPVGGGQAFVLSGGDPSTYELRIPDPPDGWEQWAAARDAHEDQALARRYVSPEVIGYEDLDDHGAWRADPAYGPVWVPTVAADWAPYRDGRWAWVEPWGWTWIDDAPWGFAPFHYGRWARLDDRWAWVPGALVARPVYAPALVAFVGGPGSGLAEPGGHPGIGWFPLAPSEIYVPPYPVSPAYVQQVNVTTVNVTTVNVAHVDVTTINYRNRAVPGGVTVVARDVFVGARPVGPAVIRTPPQSLATAPVVGMGAPPTAPSLLAPTPGHRAVETLPHGPVTSQSTSAVVAKPSRPAPLPTVAPTPGWPAPATILVPHRPEVQAPKGSEVRSTAAPVPAAPAPPAPAVMNVVGSPGRLSRSPALPGRIAVAPIPPPRNHAPEADLRAGRLVDRVVVKAGGPGTPVELTKTPKGGTAPKPADPPAGH